MPPRGQAPRAPTAPASTPQPRLRGMVGFIELVVGRIDVDCVGVMEEDCERRAVEVLSVEIVLLGGVMALVV